MYKIYFHNGRSFSVSAISLEFDENHLPVDIVIMSDKQTIQEIADDYSVGPCNLDNEGTALFARLKPFAILPEGVYNGWGN